MLNCNCEFNNKIFKIDAERSLIFVKGSVPGKAGNVLYLRDAVKNAHKND